MYSRLCKFRMLLQFWQVVLICQIWSILPHVAILGKICHFCVFDYELILVPVANFGNCSPFWHFGTFTMFRNTIN